jgi:spore germination protein (amino acid permease)
VKEKLHPFHVTLLIYLVQSGVVIFSLPRLLAGVFGYNGWLSIIIFALISSFNIFLISLVFRMGKGNSIFDILEKSVSKILLYPLYMTLIIVWSIIGCLVGKHYVNVFQMIAFPTTHPMLFKLLIDILVFLLVIKGIYNISKAATMFFVLIFWMLLLLFMFINKLDWPRLTPFIFKEGGEKFWGSLEIYSAYLGYSVSLLLIPYVDKSKKFIKGVYAANGLTTFTYITVSFVCFSFYSLPQLKKMKFPLLDLLAYIELPFIERMENLLFGFFLFSIIITIVMYLWSAILILERIIPKANKNLLAFIILFTTFFVSWIPDVLSEVETWLRYFSYAEIIISFGLPLFLIITLLVRKGGLDNG